MPTITRLTPDEAVYKDNTISIAAKGLYATIMATKGDPDDVLRVCKEERIEIRKYIKELLDKGYCKQSKDKLTFGKKEHPITTFTVTEELRGWASTKLIHCDLEYLTERWRNHHLSKGTKIRNLSASWRNWMLGHVKFDGCTACFKPVKVVVEGNFAEQSYKREKFITIQ